MMFYLLFGMFRTFRVFLVLSNGAAACVSNSVLTASVNLCVLARFLAARASLLFASSCSSPTRLCALSTCVHSQPPRSPSAHASSLTRPSCTHPFRTYPPTCANLLTHLPAPIHLHAPTHMHARTQNREYAKGSRERRKDRGESPSTSPRDSMNLDDFSIDSFADNGGGGSGRGSGGGGGAHGQNSSGLPSVGSLDFPGF
jgi:uncharacterized membrane protein YgcG